MARALVQRRVSDEIESFATASGGLADRHPLEYLLSHCVVR